MLKDYFPRARFGPPATDAAIADVEAALGVTFPEQLRALYRQCDGFREDKGNAKYLLSLTEEDFIGSLQSITSACWTEFSDAWPSLDLTPFIFFGFSFTDHMWGINWRSGNEIIAFHHHMEGSYEVVGSDILAVYRADHATYAG